jgi:hypothetical protein
MGLVAMVRKLKRLPHGARRGLLYLLQSQPEAQAHLIAQLYAREETRNLA